VVKRLFLMAAVITIALPSMGLAQVSEDWVARYNGPWNGYDYARAVAVDASGNVYVTGSSSGTAPSAVVTVKYNSSGVLEWVAQYSEPGDYWDGATAMAVDGSGNVYVTGFVTDAAPEHYYDYATIKYDADGNQKWVARYDNGIWDAATAIALDAAGDVYVTGTSYGPWADFATVKYRGSDGYQLWTARYNGPGNNYDWAFAIAVDASYNVFVSGSDDLGYATVKYDASGNQQWVSHLSGNGNASKIALDAAGNVYVGGGSGTPSAQDYTAAKFDANGNQLWVATYDHGGQDHFHDMALDASGNVYVTGESFDAIGSDDFATVKYDANGNQLWVARYNGPGNSYEWGWAIALDASGNVYVTGGNYDANWVGDYVTVKYDPDGQEMWVARYDNGDDDGAAAIAVDASGNVYVTGPSYGSGTDCDYATVRYSQRVAIEATIDIDPNELNLKSNGKWVTCSIELPTGHNVNDINLSTVALSAIDGQPLDPLLYREGPTGLGDYDHDQIRDLMVKFDRQKLIAILRDMGYGDGDRPELTVTGGLTGNTTFKGVDTIGLIDKKGGGQGSAADLPKSLSVQQSSPNPFRLTTTIRYGLPAETPVRLEVYSPAGQRVATLVDEFEGAGYHSVNWDGKDDGGRELVAGVYFFRFDAGTYQTTKKTQLLR
jgi:hypothetical protein